jgi:hypothetical protein
VQRQRLVLGKSGLAPHLLHPLLTFPPPPKHNQPPPQVGAQTETELKEKKLRVEDALNATKAAVEEGIVIGGGCTLLKLAARVESIKEGLSNEEQKVGADIVRKVGFWPSVVVLTGRGWRGWVSRATETAF